METHHSRLDERRSLERLGMPHFEREVLQQAIDDGRIGDGAYYEGIILDEGALAVQALFGKLPSDHDWSEVIATLRAGDEVYDHEIAKDVRIQAEFFPTVSIMVDGRQIDTYPLGAGSWCWNQYSEPTQSAVSQP